MADTVDSTGTTATIAVGGSYTDRIETSGDHDWIRLELRAGQSVTIKAASSGSPGLSDPVVTMRDSAGTVLRTVDNGLSEDFFFTATTTGSYYIDVSGFRTGTGQYTVGVTNRVPPPTEVADQWHLPLLGDIDAVWADYTGRGVHVGIYDEGVQYTHHDLDGNYDASRHVTVNGQVADPMPPSSSSGHGTSVAGLIAAENDGIGPKGVAYNASITSVDIYSGPASDYSDSNSGFIQAVDQAELFDVINNSWSYDANFAEIKTAMQAVSEWFEASMNGRGGLGTVVVQSAGNDSLNAIGSPSLNTRATIVVGAYDDTGDASPYTNFGANLLISAPSSGGTKGLVTTDLLADDGYEAGDYNNAFGGTSGAAPLVTGVIALMLQANTNLGWRDVREILGISATSVGSGVGGTKTVDESDNWFYNSATTWNGGGLHFSRDYGFGGVNAFNAVRMAEAWSLFDGPATSGDESRATVSTSGSAALTDNGTTSVSFDFSGTPFSVESVDVSVDITHAKLNSLRIELVSAAGSVVKLFNKDISPTGSNLKWSFNANAFLGEHGQGIWTVRVTDTAAGNTGTLNSASVTLNGSSLNLADDVYHYTDEFSDTLGLAGQGGRAVLSDTDGGVDWIEAAAVRTNTTVNLKDGTATIDGVALVLSGIENVLTGDGNDELIGSDAGNRLVGMRGDDSLYGGDGDDILEGGSGGDRLFGGDGVDTISYERATAGVTVDIDRSADNTGEAAGDLYANVEDILGSAFGDVLRGAAENNRIVGGAGSDALLGRGGDDILVGGLGGDLLDGGEGIDTVSYEDALVGLTVDIDQSLDNTGEAAGDGYANTENILGSAFDDILRGAAENNWIEGGAGNDTLDGRGGSDTLLGGRGDDTYVTDGFDMITEAVDAGIDTVRSSATLTLGTNLENLVLTGKAAINATGNSLANTLTGNDGANVLNGLGGADTMIGGAGSDTYYVDNVGDRCVEASGASGTDLVYASVSCTLNAEVENLTLTGSASINGTGNALANVITGNAGANVLDGKAGADTMAGGSGDDRYYVDTSADLVAEARSAGTDTVYSGISYRLGAGQYVEQLFTGNDAATTALSLSGNEFGNRIKGNAGDNTLNGGLGADTLYGLKGKDTFVFNTALSSGNVDHLGDFSAADDTIKLAQSIFTAISTGTLAEGAFKDLSVAGATVDANDRILYDKATGALSYDADGSGSKAAVQFAIVDTKATLTASDFLIVS